MTLEEFTLHTGYVPETTGEFDAIEHDRKVFNAPVKLFCKLWIKCYYQLKASEVMRRKRSAEHFSEVMAYDIMLGNMRNAYQASLS